MGPETTMSTFSLSSSSDSTTLAIPKLRDDGSNWSDYEPRLRKAMGAKALWRHIEGTAVAPTPYTVNDGVHLLADLTTPATDEQVEAKESKIIDFEKREYLAQHILLSTTSIRLGAKIKDLTTAEEMWKIVKEDATQKSTLHLLDAEEQLQSMKLSDNGDSKTHLTELKQHFQLMIIRRDNLIKIGSIMSDARFNIIIMSSLPDSYRPTLQTITAAERASKLSGKSESQSRQMKPDDLIDFIIEEAQHRVINDERGKNAESALAAHTRRTDKRKASERKHEKKDTTDFDEVCDNCGKAGHTNTDCWSKGGGKEGQGPRHRKSKNGNKSESAVVAVDENNDELFAFVCTSAYANVAKALKVPKSRLGTCVDSGASRDYCPDRERFTNYRPIDHNITTADGRTIKAIGMGDMHLELPNGLKKTNTTFKNGIHAPEMAFTLISISRLDKAGYSVTFNKGMCTIKNKSGRVIATIPHSDGLYRVAVSNAPESEDHSNVASEKMSISEAHRKLGHIAHAAVKHAISKGLITGINLDLESKPEFCEACAKAKSARLPFPDESHTRAAKYGERVHWDVWGPASVKSLNGHSYVAARIDDATRETKLYFQNTKSDTFENYKKDEAYIENQAGNRIRVVRSDRGGEFLSKEMMNHQDQKGTIRETTVHDSPPQNGVAERGMRTRAERARALLLASGLPCFLWEEAMKHSTWLQNRTPTRALDGKTPYEMIHKKKPNLAGIQEFGAAAYVKDLKAGKLDARAKVGRFVGYDSESKGFRIYWPATRSVSVERNVVFNENDIRNDDGTVPIPGALSEGEKEADKVIQHPENSVEGLKKAQDDQNDDSEEKSEIEQQSKTNTVPFPPQAVAQEPDDEPHQPQERPQRAARYQGNYRDLTASVAIFEDHDDTAGPAVVEDPANDGYLNCFDDLPLDFATVGHNGTDPQTLDEALRGSNAKEWQAAMDYEISQLQKFETWQVDDLWE